MPEERGRLRREVALNPLPDPTIHCQKTLSSSAAPLNGLDRGRLFGRRRYGTGCLKPAQNIIGGVLQPCIRLMELTGCFACQLTELVAIGHMRECPKYQIRTHCKFLLQISACPPGTSWLRWCSRGVTQIGGAPPFHSHLLDAHLVCPVRSFHAQLHVMRYSCYVRLAACRLGIPNADCFSP
jgi:hypothetical protein